MRRFGCTAWRPLLRVAATRRWQGTLTPVRVSLKELKPLSAAEIHARPPSRTDTVHQRVPACVCVCVCVCARARALVSVCLCVCACARACRRAGECVDVRVREYVCAGVGVRGAVRGCARVCAGVRVRVLVSRCMRAYVRGQPWINGTVIALWA